jgi:hypothetical protein
VEDAKQEAQLRSSILDRFAVHGQHHVPYPQTSSSRELGIRDRDDHRVTFDPSHGDRWHMGADMSPKHVRERHVLVQ